MSEYIATQRKIMAGEIRKHRRFRDTARIDGDHEKANTHHALAKSVLNMSRIFQKTYEKKVLTQKGSNITYSS